MGNSISSKKKNEENENKSIKKLKTKYNENIIKDTNYKELNFPEEKKDGKRKKINIKKYKLSFNLNIYLEENAFRKKSNYLSLPLSTIRGMVNNIIYNNFSFIDANGKSVNLKEENNLTVSEVINDCNKINLKIAKAKNMKKFLEIKEDIITKDTTIEIKDENENNSNYEDIPIEQKKKKMKIKDLEKEEDINDLFLDNKEKTKEESDSSENKRVKKKKKKKNKKKKKIKFSDDENELNNKFINNIAISKESSFEYKIKRPLPGFEKIEKIGDLDIYLYKSENFSDEEWSQAINLLVVGEAGVGKTTLLNCYLNYLLGIELSDKFRYKLIYEDYSPKKLKSPEVSIYPIRRPNKKPIIIIDTPGFGDINGINNDKNIESKIRDYLSNKISTINAVCLVIKGTTNRLNSSQKYIFDCILNLFGKDIKENFVVLITFCDGLEPQILSSLQSDESIFKDIINHLEKDEWYFQFNNSVFFNSKINDYSKIFWDLSIMSYEKFTRKIEKLPAKSLSLTKQVLEERAELENNVSNLISHLDNALNIMNNFKNTIKQLEKLKGDLENNKDFVIEVDEFYTEQIDLSGKGIYTTTCLKCNFTCHNDCSYSEDSDKKNVKFLKVIIA